MENEAFSSRIEDLEYKSFPRAFSQEGFIFQKYGSKEEFKIILKNRETTPDNLKGDSCNTGGNVRCNHLSYPYMYCSIFVKYAEIIPSILLAGFFKIYFNSVNFRINRMGLLDFLF